VKRIVKRIGDYLKPRKERTKGNQQGLKEWATIPDSEFIKMAYLTLLKREPDPDGFNFYLQKLQCGEITRDDLLSNLLHSVEFENKHDHIPLHEFFLDPISVGSPELFRPYVKTPPYSGGQINELANPYKWIDSNWRRFAKDLRVVPTSLPGMHGHSNGFRRFTVDYFRKNEFCPIVLGVGVDELIPLDG
jgi:hypothetical protein